MPLLALLALSGLWLGACASGAADGVDASIPDADDDSGDGNTTRGDGDGNGDGDGDGDGNASSIGDQDFSADDPNAVSGEGSSGNLDDVDTAGDGDTTDASMCLDREEALAALEGLEINLPSCEDDVCKKAHCLPVGLVSESQRELLRDCTPTDKCVPDSLIATLGMAPLEVCESLDGAEGRCISPCVPLVADQADVLPRSTCADDELCAPCFDPITQLETGACGQTCDTGPVDDPYFFPDCCGDLGVCVPDAIVPAGQVALLGKDTCSGDGVLCAPRDFATDRDLVPPTCTSLLGAEGRCLAACIPQVAQQADRLPQDVCDTGHLCAPCFDPITGVATGACAIGDDPGPIGGAVVFERCCDAAGTDVGVCVPEDIVPSDQVALLGPDSCVGEDLLCAPADIAAGTYVPDACSAPGDIEGRCLPACLPDIAAQASFLTREDCAAGYLCAPCFDPFTGLSTGSCTLEGDSPTNPPVTLETCCNDGASDVGTCVPTGFVPGALQSMLDDDGGMCMALGGEATLCAPTDVATGTYTPQTCSSWHGRSNADASAKQGPGRCLPACLPDVAAKAALLTPDGSDGCGDPNERCAPCHDPTTGLSTGACTLTGDTEPTEVMTFTNCCTNLGRCIPSTAAGARAASLPTLTCEGSGEPGAATAEDYVCAPNQAVANPSHVFTSCSTTCGADIGTCILAAFGGVPGQPGVCLPSCMLSETTTPIGGNAANLYGQSTCATGEDCAPCTDPTSNMPTGACP